MCLTAVIRDLKVIVRKLVPSTLSLTEDVRRAETEAVYVRRLSTFL